MEHTHKFINNECDCELQRAISILENRTGQSLSALHELFEEEHTPWLLRFPLIRKVWSIFTTELNG